MINKLERSIKQGHTRLYINLLSRLCNSVFKVRGIQKKEEFKNAVLRCLLNERLKNSFISRVIYLITRLYATHTPTKKRPDMDTECTYNTP